MAAIADDENVPDLEEEVAEIDTGLAPGNYFNYRDHDVALQAEVDLLDGISGYFGSIVSAGPNSTHNGTFLFSTWDKGYGKRASAKVRENPTHTKL